MAAILIVDDDPMIRTIATEFLREGDHAIVEAGDGLEAMHVLKAVPFDLMVLDMLMPEMDGLETIMEARQVQPSLRILAISSGGSMDARHLLEVARTLGAHAVLTKPLTAVVFRSVVEDLLGGESARPAQVRTSI
ncbi:MAG: response regulator [Brevundimonas sp.]|uniref:response regulator n=1 Tax=Brevundimonas sp. TaxID=1871086 RepID=UPI0039193F97